MDLAATYLAVITVFTSLGYYASGFAKPPQIQVRPPHQQQPNTTLQDDSDSESEDGNVSALTTSDECKLVLAVRTDLGMTTGKIAAQCSHATLACYKTLASKNPDLLRRWARGGYLKSAVRCSDEDELLLLQGLNHG
ncbi:peptidyl-tRNA hydrolase PTH2-domain-containing protein [Mycena alexandri]|uniref:peptidyl-tRNA hydrolase n=1 Tax=Mycena alexandri TaxID=1745969 RepID=A0AAD6TCF1_9AGAR|nr:peptidyl-tRNA hydrolase PTH2-domain-containing protein [Mycena alexandri]